MKKAAKIALALAAAAALTPYSVRKDEDGNPTIRALLWEYSSGPDPEDPTKRRINLFLGPRLSRKDEPDAPIVVEPAIVEAPVVTEEPAIVEEPPIAADIPCIDPE